MVSEEEKVRSKDNKFGQVWASLRELGQVWASFGKVWANLSKFGQVRAS